MSNQPNHEQLRLLSIFHYVLGGLGAVIGGLNAISAIRLVASLSSFDSNPSFEPLTSRMLVPLVVLSTLVFGVLAISFCLILAGRNLARRRSYTFVFVIACIECIGFPFGTILGAFTIFVLCRPEVKQLFQEASAPPPPA